MFSCGHKKSPTSVGPSNGSGKSSADLCDWRLQLADDLSLLGRSGAHALISGQVHAPRMFTISRPLRFAQVRTREFSRGFSRGGGAEGIRTPDLRRAKAALSQLSYGPAARSFSRTQRHQPTRVGQPGIEPGTSVLSGLRSSRLSYWPAVTPCSLPDQGPEQHPIQPSACSSRD